MTGVSFAELRFPKIEPHKDAPRLDTSPAHSVWADQVARRLPPTHLRKLAPNLWGHLLGRCKAPYPRSDGQRGRWAEFRVRLVQDRVAKAARARLTPPALALALLEVAEAHHVREPQLEAVCALLSLKRDQGGSAHR